MSDLDKVQEAGTTLLMKLVAALDVGIEKAPEVFGELAIEYSKYYVIENLPLVSFSFLVASSVLLGVCVWKWNALCDEMAQPIIAFPLVGVVLGLGFFFSGAKSSLQAYVTPKAFLIESIRGGRCQ